MVTFLKKIGTKNQTCTTYPRTPSLEKTIPRSRDRLHREEIRVRQSNNGHPKVRILKFSRAYSISEKERLIQEIKLYKEEAQREESRFHNFQSQQLLLDAQIFKASNPLLDDQGTTIKDKYTRATQEQEQLSKSLREQQKVI